MPHLPFALSISHYLNSAGTDAGFAAIVGLAVLVLLYFAQARESAGLREHADELAYRVEELETRLDEVLRQQARSVPACRPPGGGAPAGPPPPAGDFPRPAAAQMPLPAGEPRISDARPLRLLPFAPAGSAAPALAAATRLIPLPRPVLQPVAAAGSRPVAAVAGGGEPLLGGTATAVAAPPPLPAGEATMAAPPPAPEPLAPPATVAAGANGMVPRLGSSAQRQSSPPPPPPPPRTATRAAAMAGATRTFAERGPAGRNAPSAPRRRLLPVLAGLGALVIAVVVAVILISGGGSSANRTTAASRHPARPTGHPAVQPFSPAQVTVAVLNGTSVNGLAHATALRLARAGYRQGAITTASDQTHTATIVGYFENFRDDALHVARSLGLGSASVQPVDSATAAVACPPGTACTAQVAVTVGTDLASSSTTGAASSAAAPTTG
jgi:hypothetical protein